MQTEGVQHDHSNECETTAVATPVDGFPGPEEAEEDLREKGTIFPSIGLIRFLLWVLRPPAPLRVPVIRLQDLSLATGELALLWGWALL